MIKAVVFDLDDTLISEIEYVKSGFRAIEREFNIPGLSSELYKLFQLDRKNVFQRLGFSQEDCQKCIEIYRNHMPDIALAKETEKCLIELRNRGYKLGIITDGRSEGQRNKITALGLDSLVDHIIITDELGGTEFRKPHPKAFELMQKALSVEFNEMMYIGDNPYKDFYIGCVFPIVTIHLQATSMYEDDQYYKNIQPKIVIQHLSYETIIKICENLI